MTSSERYQTTVDRLNSLREQRREAIDAGQRDAAADLANRIVGAEEAMCRAHDAAIAEWQSSLCPTEAAIDERGKITLRNVSLISGGRFRYLSPGDVGYDAWLAKIERDKGIDARVAEVAYAKWEWRGPVRIDYFGDIAHVRDGGRTVKVDTRTMEAIDDAR